MCVSLFYTNSHDRPPTFITLTHFCSKIQPERQHARHGLVDVLVSKLQGSGRKNNPNLSWRMMKLMSWQWSKVSYNSIFWALIIDCRAGYQQYEQHGLTFQSMWQCIGWGSPVSPACYQSPLASLCRSTWPGRSFHPPTQAKGWSHPKKIIK